MTPFEQVQQELEVGKRTAPSISVNGSQVNPIAYQLITDKFSLSIFASGMTRRGVTFTQLKKFYGLKGRSAKDVMPQFMVIFNKHMKPESVN